jgi:MoaA/NifB/PqqE/SkfB family radical SAM enzyme
MNVLLDEIATSPESWARAPRQVSVALTNACDLECPFCYAPKFAARADAGRVRAWMDELDEAGCLGVGFGGGEPTLYRWLPELCRHGAQSTGLAVTLTTHGHRITKRLIDELTGCVHFIRISMDGVGRTYEGTRGRPFASFMEILTTVAAVFRFGINFVVNSTTVTDLGAAAAIAADVGASELLLLPEVPANGRPGVDAATMKTMREWVRRYDGMVPLAISERSAGELPTAIPLPSETGLRAYAHIDAAGTVRRSSYAWVGVRVGSDGVLSAIAELSRMETA